MQNKYKFLKYISILFITITILFSCDFNPLADSSNFVVYIFYDMNITEYSEVSVPSGLFASFSALARYGSTYNPYNLYSYNWKVDKDNSEILNKNNGTNIFSFKPEIGIETAYTLTCEVTDLENGKVTTKSIIVNTYNR